MSDCAFRKSQYEQICTSHSSDLFPFVCYVYMQTYLPKSQIHIHFTGILLHSAHKIWRDKIKNPVQNRTKNNCHKFAATNLNFTEVLTMKTLFHSAMFSSLGQIQFYQI